MYTNLSGILIRRIADPCQADPDLDPEPTLSKNQIRQSNVTGSGSSKKQPFLLDLKRPQNLTLFKYLITKT